MSALCFKVNRCLLSILTFDVVLENNLVKARCRKNNSCPASAFHATGSDRCIRCRTATFFRQLPLVTFEAIKTVLCDGLLPPAMRSAAVGGSPLPAQQVQAGSSPGTDRHASPESDYFDYAIDTDVSSPPMGDAWDVPVTSDDVLVSAFSAVSSAPPVTSGSSIDFDPVSLEFFPVSSIGFGSLDSSAHATTTAFSTSMSALLDEGAAAEAASALMDMSLPVVPPDPMSGDSDPWQMDDS